MAISSCTISGNTASASVRAHVETSHRPDGKMADMPKSNLIFRFWIDSWFYQGYVRASHACKLPIAPMGKLLTRLLRLSLCTTGNASVNYSLYVPQRPSKVSIAPMGFSHVLRLCLQGGGVYISSSTVSFSSCTITGNTAAYVRAHAQKFPSPRWEFHRFRACACRAAVCTSTVPQ